MGYDMKQIVSPLFTKRRQIILVTYGRSGSSLTTDIIAQNPDVFTYYEPLHNLAKTFTNQQDEYRKLRDKYLHLTKIPEYNAKAVDILEQLLTCDYDRLPEEATQNHHMSWYSTVDMYKCLKTNTDEAGKEKCLSEGEASCLGKKIQFIKVIRLSVQSVGDLMKKYPCMKLIYLVRDPRGSYLSKQRAFNIISSNTTYEAERYCRRVSEDIEAAMQLKTTYPSRLYLTRYENLAEQPSSAYQKLYSFLGLNFTKQIQEFVYNHTQAGKMDTNIYSTSKGNSSEVSYAWRQKIKFEDASIFDTQCREVYYRLGYLPVNREKDLRQLKKSLKFDKSYLS
ncbi:carbohydrate sulfotransferase 3-like [Physella acuta]|uniref:carbohydrate sulfotransferase 3-like n=1 Tax=Physella acuta TaxID=109671 RepID=UPI0027DC3AE7|nr:carbohydrate sulfotransferase 3-like [Physella acuta]